MTTAVRAIPEGIHLIGSHEAEAASAANARAERVEAENARLRTALEAFALPSSKDPSAIPVSMQAIARAALGDGDAR